MISREEKDRLKKAYYALVLSAALDSGLLANAIKAAEVDISSKEKDGEVLDYLMNQINATQLFCAIKGDI